MVTYILSDKLIWSVIAFIFVLLGMTLWVLNSNWKKKKLDRVILIDKNNRWREYYDKLFSKSAITIDNKKYFLVEDCGLVNEKGKSLYIFSENKASPLKIKYNDSQWIDAKSLLGMINNDLIQKMVRPTSPAVEQLLMIGAIGGIIAGLSSVVILLIQMGVITPK